MRILVSGSSGFLGTAVTSALERDGQQIMRLVRSGSSESVSQGAGTIRWDPIAGQFDAALAEGADALIHLAGASIVGGR